MSTEVTSQINSNDFWIFHREQSIVEILQEVKDGELVLEHVHDRIPSSLSDSAEVRSAFIESVFLKIPFNNITITEGQHRKVIDGLWRLKTIKAYCENDFALIGMKVIPYLESRRYNDLTRGEQRFLWETRLTVNRLYFRNSPSKVLPPEAVIDVYNRLI